MAAHWGKGKRGGKGDSRAAAAAAAALEGPWAGRFDGVYFTEADNVLAMGSGDGMEGSVQEAHREKFKPQGAGEATAVVQEGTSTLTPEGVAEFFAARGRDCYLAPSRFEKKSVGARDDPIGGRVLVGQNVCSEGPVVVTVQQY